MGGVAPRMMKSPGSPCALPSSRARRSRCGRIFHVGALVLPGNEILYPRYVLDGSLCDPQEVAHRRNLLDLLTDEPLDELLGGVVVLVASHGGQPVDLLGDASLLFERERDRFDDVGEA